MGRAPCCEKSSGLKKGPWTPEEDQKLIDYISKNGYGNWRTLPTNAGLERCGKSCRLRWTNYLRPDIKRGRFSFEEEETIIQLHSILGNKWSAIAGKLPGRTDNEIKNYWNTHIRKRLVRMGIDPVTHSPRLDLYDLSSILYHNNQTSSRLMDHMHQSSSQLNNQLATNFYTQMTTTLSDPILDPTRMIQSHYYYDNHDQAAGFQSNVTQANLSQYYDSDYVPIPFTDIYSGSSNQNQILNNSVFVGQRPEYGQNLSMNNNNSVISTTPEYSSSSPNNSNVYMNSSSCISTEDEKEIINNNNRIDCYYYNNYDFVKFEIPDDQIFDVNEFI